MIADGIAAAEVRVGVVVRHTPADAAGYAVPDGPVALDPGVAQGVGEPMRLVVLVLGGEHMPVALGHQIPLVKMLGHVPLLQEPVARAVLGEVVVGVHVLQKVALLQVPDTAGLAGGVQAPAEFVGLRVEGVIVLALIDAHTPQHDAGVVPVLEHHLPHILQGGVLPDFVADVLPAGDLREHQQPHLVAAVDKVLALRVVAGADHVEPQAELQVVGLVPLHARRSGVADVGPALVPVEPPKVHPLPVEEEALSPELRVPEARLQRPDVHLLSLVDQSHGQLIEHGPVQVPGDRVLRLEGEFALGLRVQGEVDTQLRQGEPQGISHGGSLAQLHPDLGRPVGMGRGEHAPDMAGFGDLQSRLPVEAAVAQVVDEEAEGGLVQALPGVQPHGQPVVLPIFQIRQQKALGHVSAVGVPFGGYGLPVQEHFGIVGGPVQYQPHLLARPGGVGEDGPGIPADGLVHLLLGALPGQELGRVRQPHRLPGDLAPQKLVRAGEGKLPVVVQRHVTAHRWSPRSRAGPPGRPS